MPLPAYPHVYPGGNFTPGAGMLGMAPTSYVTHLNPARGFGGTPLAGELTRAGFGQDQRRMLKGTPMRQVESEGVVSCPNDPSPVLNRTLVDGSGVGAKEF